MSYVNDAEFNPYAAPKVQPGAFGNVALAHVEYAGFWLRFVALIIDAIILGLINLVVTFTLVLIVTAINMDELIGSLISSLCSVIVQICYNPLMLCSEKQATFGKMAVGIKVTDLRGRRIGFGRALGREFAKFFSAIILAIGYIMAAFTERKQALHDMIAGTLVVKSR